MPRTKMPHRAHLSLGVVLVDGEPCLEAFEPDGREVYVSLVSAVGDPTPVSTADRMKALAGKLHEQARVLENNRYGAGDRLARALQARKMRSLAEHTQRRSA